MNKEVIGMSNSYDKTSTYEELKQLYDQLQTNIEQTEKLLTHLTGIKARNCLPHKALYIDRMLTEQHEKYQLDLNKRAILKQQLNI